jgi:hypothetical protein
MKKQISKYSVSTVFFLIGVLAILSCARPPNANKNNANEGRPDLTDDGAYNKYSKVAIDAAFSNIDKWVKNPKDLESLDKRKLRKNLIREHIRSDALKNVIFFVLEDPTEKPGEDVIVAVDSNLNYLFAERSNFEKILRINKKRIETKQDAYEIANLYVHLFGIPFPRAWKSIKILKDYKEIDVNNAKSISPEIADIISSPSIRFEDGIYVVSFFTWSPIGGNLVYWDIRVSETADIRVKEEVVREAIGNCYLPK